ncbi:helix-hairpin-helix domain-containing protein [archaeon]|nr:helix-hairpin-helix domain-containing protein [archaeon]
MTNISEVKGIGPATAVKLAEAGIDTAEALAEFQLNDLTELVGKTTATKIQKNAKAVVKKTAKKAAKKPAKKAAKKPAKKAAKKPAKKAAKKPAIKDLKGDADKEDTTWSVKSKELTDEEREARRQRQEMLRAAERITREIPLPPKPIKAVKSGKKVKVPKPIKKQKDEKVVQQQVKKSKAEKKAERFVDYYKAKELISSNVSDKPKIYSSKKGKEEPRVEIKRDTLLGRFSSKRRSRRNVNDRQMIVDIIDEYEAEMLIGQKIYYEMNNVKISGYIVRRFGKKKNKKVLANFKNGLSEEAKYKNVYKY